LATSSALLEPSKNFLPLAGASRQRNSDDQQQSRVDGFFHSNASMNVLENKPMLVSLFYHGSKHLATDILIYFMYPSC